jgi:hypothetical protein
MKTALGAFTALLLAGAMYMQPADAQVQVQPAPGFSVQIGPGAPPLPPAPPEEWRGREGYYGSGWEDRQREHRARLHCDRIPNPMERDRCFESFR